MSSKRSVWRSSTLCKFPRCSMKRSLCIQLTNGSPKQNEKIEWKNSVTWCLNYNANRHKEILFHVEWERLRWNVYELRTVRSWFFKLKLMLRRKKEVVDDLSHTVASYPFQDSFCRPGILPTVVVAPLPFVVCSCKRRSLLRSCHENSKETSEIIREFDTFLVLFVFALHFRDCVDRNANREWWAQWFYASGREIRKQSFTSCIDASLTIHDAPFHCTVMSRVIWNVVTTTNCSQPQQRFKFIGKFHLRNARRKFSDECDSTKDDFIARLSSQYRVRSGKRENALAVFFFFFFFNSGREKRKA